MKRIICFASILSLCLLNFSCKKGEESASSTAVLGVRVKNASAIYEVPEHQSVNIELNVVAAPTSAEAYTITLGANPGLVSFYNSKNGTSYKMLPSSAYTISSSSVVLPRYSATSSTCKILLKGEGCEAEQTYVLPVSIDGVMGGTSFRAPDEQAAYILFKMLPSESEGSGTESDPYIVKDVASFCKVNSLLQEDATIYFKQTADLDFNGVFSDQNPWVAINSGEADLAVKRRIVYDGNGHKISNFKAGAGLFAILPGCVKNLTVEGADIDCAVKNMGGVIAGHAFYVESVGRVVAKNVKVKNSKIVSDYDRNGGLIGYLSIGDVEDCEADCALVAIGAQNGGLIGRVEDCTLTNCSASGNITADKYYNGGLVGMVVNATISKCHATGNVTHTTGNYSRIGGLVGEIDGNVTITECYATGNLTGTGHYAGGLVGVLNGEGTTTNISRSYATGNLTMPTGANWAHAGGLVGSISQSNITLNIANCYATGKIVCERYSSGFVGSIYGANKSKLTITNGYTTSDISGVIRLFGIVLGANSEETTLSCQGFVAWNVSDKPFCYPEDALQISGNYYGKEGTVSSQAAKLGWDTTIWDLSKDMPTLK